MPEPDNEQEETERRPTADNTDNMPSLTPPVSKKRKRTIEDQRLDKAFEILTASVSKERQDDECHIFGNLIAKKMEKYSPITRGEVQHAIMDILLRADRGQYDRNLYPVPSPIHPTNSQYPQYSQNYSGHPPQCPPPMQDSVTSPAPINLLSSQITTPISPHSNTNNSSESNSQETDMDFQEFLRFAK